MPGKPVPIIERKKIFKIGNSVALFLPLEWFRAHGWGTTPEEIIENLKKSGKIEVLILGDKDLRIVNPDHEARVLTEMYSEVSEKVKNAEILKE